MVVNDDDDDDDDDEKADIEILNVMTLRGGPARALFELGVLYLWGGPD